MSEWYEMQPRPRIKRPKNAQYRDHCFECRNWAFMRQVGVAVDGRCHAVAGCEGPVVDAYEQACWMFSKGKHADEIDTDGGHE